MKTQYREGQKKRAAREAMAEAFVNARTRSGASTRELAARVGCTHTVVNQAERVESGLISPSMARTLGTELGMSEARVRQLWIAAKLEEGLERVTRRAEKAWPSKAK